MKQKQEEYDFFKREFETWENNFPNRCEGTILTYCEQKAEPVLTHYKNLFRDQNGDNYSIRKAAFACKLFDPMYLKGKENELHTLYYLANQLVHFQYSEFDGNFLQLLKNEIPTAIGHANALFNWEDIDTTAQFKTRMQRRIKRHNLTMEDVSDWRKDPGERASKIWEWWRIRLISDKTELSAFGFALRLVILSQTLSC